MPDNQESKEEAQQCSVSITCSLADGVQIHVSPRDINAVWWRDTPFAFTCLVGTEYVFSCPSIKGYAKFAGWRNVKTGEQVSTSYLLTITPTEDSEYVCEYKMHHLVDFTVSSTKPKAGIPVEVSPPDVNGVSSFVTPKKLTYLSETKVTVSLTDEPVISKSNAFDQAYVEKHKFYGWRQNEGWNTSLSPVIEISDDARTLELNYSALDVPWYPTASDVTAMKSQLKFIIPKNEADEQLVILLDGEPLKVGGESVFRNRMRAEAALRSVFAKLRHNWIARVQPGLQDWLKNDENRELVLTDLLAKDVELVPFTQLLVNNKPN